MKKVRSRIQILKRIAAVVGWKQVVEIFARRALGLSEPIKVTLPGGGPQLNVRPTFDDPWVLLQVFGDREYEPATKMNLGSILDLGGNCGFTSVYLATRFPNAKIVAVEPDPENFKVLSLNIAPFPNVSAIRAAAWNFDGFVNLNDPSAQSSMRSFSAPGEGDGGDGARKTPCLTIGSISRDAGVSRWDLIKIDVEGAEIQLLGSAAEWIDKTNALAVEIHDFCAEEAKSLLKTATPSWQRYAVHGETHWCER